MLLGPFLRRIILRPDALDARLRATFRALVSFIDTSEGISGTHVGFMGVPRTIFGALVSSNSAP